MKQTICMAVLTRYWANRGDGVIGALFSNDLKILDFYVGGMNWAKNRPFWNKLQQIADLSTIMAPNFRISTTPDFITGLYINSFDQLRVITQFWKKKKQKQKEKNKTFQLWPFLIWCQYIGFTMSLSAVNLQIMPVFLIPEIHISTHIIEILKIR